MADRSNSLHWRGQVENSAATHTRRMASCGRSLHWTSVVPRRRQFDRPAEYRIQHGFCEPPGEGILLTNVIRAQQRPSLGTRTTSAERHFHSVPKSRPRPDSKKVSSDLIAESAKHNHHIPRGKQLKLTLQKRAATISFLYRWFVPRRSATNRCRDVRAAEFLTIVQMRTVRLTSETGSVKRSIEPVPRAIAREHSASSVRAVRSRRQPDDDDPRRWIAEPGDWPPPIRLIAICRPLLNRNLFSPRN